MAWIREILPDEADDDLASRYREATGADGVLDHIMRIHGVHPAALAAHQELYVTSMKRPSPLSRARREMIAVVVSSINECHYWLVHHGAGLRRVVDDEALVEALSTDYRGAELPDAERRMLDFVAKLTTAPGKMQEQDVESLRAAGFDDRAIHDVVLVAGYYAFVNRVADGLGVALEPGWSEEGP